MTPNGIHYLMGRACWHVVGYRPGGSWVFLCGRFPDEYAIGGTSADVAHSYMPVCRTCNRATGGQAVHLNGEATA